MSGVPNKISCDPVDMYILLNDVHDSLTLFGEDNTKQFYGHLVLIERTLPTRNFKVKIRGFNENPETVRIIPVKAGPYAVEREVTNLRFGARRP